LNTLLCISPARMQAFAQSGRWRGRGKMSLGHGDILNRCFFNRFNQGKTAWPLGNNPY
jgi:hypothetical protein